jgi:hypothetical protein
MCNLFTTAKCKSKKTRVNKLNAIKSVEITHLNFLVIFIMSYSRRCGNQEISHPVRNNQSEGPSKYQGRRKP